METPPIALADPELQEYLGQLGRIEADFRELTDPLSTPQMSWRRDPDSWSILECVAHMNRTIDSYLPIIDQAVERGRALGRVVRNRTRGTLLGRWLIRSIEPPVRTRFRAPKIFQPRTGITTETVVSDFFRLRRSVRESMVRADGLDLGRIRIASPALKLLQLNLSQAFNLITAHDRRHLSQARGVRRSPGFPA